MKYSLLTALLFVVFIPTISESRTWLVEPDSSGQVINIQAGIDSAAAGDTVLVAPGGYTGDGNWDLDFKGKSIVVRSDEEAAIVSDDLYLNMHLFSGYVQPSEFFMDSRNLFETLSDALENIDIKQMQPSDEHYGVHFHTGEDSTAVLEGFQIIGFYPAILIEGASPSIRDNDILSFMSTKLIHLENSKAEIIYNRAHSYSLGGTIISCTGSHALIRDNEIRARQYDNDCCGIYCNSDSATIANNYISGDNGRLINCTDSYNIIADNTLYRGRLNFNRGSYDIRNNNISGSYYWDGVTCDSCTTVISNNHFKYSGMNALVLNAGTHMISGNTITHGGWVAGSGVKFNNIDSNTVFTSNFVYSNAVDAISAYGGISCYHSSPIISDNVIVYNDGYFYGGGIRCEYSSPHIIRNTIAYNTTIGVYCCQSSPVIENCIIGYNSDAHPPYGGGIYCADELSVPTIMNCNVYGHGADYYGIPDQTGINGNFSLAPIFCDPDNLEFTLHALSPCLPENNPYGPECGLIGALGVGCNFVATLLQSFDAEYDDSAVRIEWKVSEVSDISDFEIYRAAAPGWEFLAVNDPELDGGGTSFTYRDRDISPGTAYKYRVLVFDDPAPRVLFETDRIAVPAIPLALNQNYPNPFNPATRITYQVPKNNRVTLDVYDVSGRLVTRLVDDVQETGSHYVDWNGTNSNGSGVSSGTYFYRLTSGKEVISKKMVLLR